jgi:Uridine kinase
MNSGNKLIGDNKLDDNKLRVHCKNTGKDYMVKVGTKLIDFLHEINYDNGENKILAAYVDNQLKELSYSLYMAHSVEFIDYTSNDGRRTYMRSLCFVLQKAVHDLYPEYQLILDYSLPNGLYGELHEKEVEPGTLPKVINICDSDIEKLKAKMQEIIEADFPIIKTKLKTQEAVSLFLRHGQKNKAKLFETIGKFFVSVYYIDGYGDTFYGPLLISTSYIHKFNLIKYNKGFCLQSPTSLAPNEIPHLKYQEKLYDIFKENSDWCTIIGAKDIGTINRAVLSGGATRAIQISEALHERKYAAIADKIFEKRERVKLVLIAGPSSSGKTTTSKRLALQLKVLGLNPVIIAMDDYFLNRELTPKDENGDYDFESVYALNIQLLNTQLNQLFNGEEIELPKFNFHMGRSEASGNKIKLTDTDILIMEGIHALNPVLTEQIENDKKFKIFASALTSLSIDENNSISTTDNRLLRRMVRDNNFRGITAEETIIRWPSVVRGESKNIFPYQENADAMFNSSLIYELPLLKHYAEPLLRRILPSSPAYAESLRLLKFLSYIVEINSKEEIGIPPTSVMREFIGGSTFVY